MRISFDPKILPINLDTEPPMVNEVVLGLAGSGLL